MRLKPLWAIISNEKTTLQTFAEYGLRFDIEAHGSPKRGIRPIVSEGDWRSEASRFGLSAVACLQENFLDDQSAGWNIRSFDDT